MVNGLEKNLPVQLPVTDPVRLDIMNGARELFMHFGFRKTTMEDIAKKIGKSKSALYYYYKTKEEIFDAMAQEDMARQFHAVTTAMHKVEGVQLRFREFVVSSFENLINRKEEFSVFRAELIENPALIIELARKNDHFFEGVMKDLLLYGIRRGEIKDMTHEEIDVWAKAINAALRGIGTRLFLGNDQNDFHKHFAFIADALFAGILKPT